MFGAAWPGGSARATARASFDPDKPSDRVLAYRKLAHSLDETVTWTWLRGRRYGLVENVLHVFWDMYVGTLFRTKDLADGTYEVVSISTSFYADPLTGAPLERFDNPITGARVAIGVFAPTPQRARYGPAGRLDRPANTPAGVQSRFSLGRAWTQGGELIIEEDVAIRGLPDHPFSVNDLTTYLGRLDDVVDPRKLNPPSRLIFTDANSWPDWLEMGATPGTYFSRATGAKAFAFGDAPRFWREQMQRKHPQIVRDPAAALSG